MLCKKYIGYFTLFCLPLLFSCVFCSHVSAISDEVMTITSADTFPYTICDNYSNNVKCSSYHYIKFNPTNNVQSLAVKNSYFTVLGMYGIRVPNFTPSIYSLDSGSTIIEQAIIQNWDSNLTSLTITLTESIDSCPPVESCPEIPENPYDQKLDNITQAIYIAAATLLVIYFFYCIYRLIIKNSGVK